MRSFRPCLAALLAGLVMAAGAAAAPPTASDRALLADADLHRAAPAALRAIGTSRAQVAAIVLLEALWLGLLGAGLGSLLGWGAMLAINAAEVKMPPPPGAVDPIDLRLAFVPEAFAGALALMLVVLALAAVGPVARVVRLRVAEALASV